METRVSVVICVRDAEKYISNCIRSILDQTFDDFEIVIIDDMSSDNTKNIIEDSGDKRIRYLRNRKWLGVTKSRNRGLKRAEGEYIFFTDGDCVVSRNWIEEGLKVLKVANCAGVEGKIYYVSKNYRPTFSDHVCKNEEGGLFMTGNMAYRKRIIESVGGFDERYSYHEDRDLALRILKKGRIGFNPDMIVYVQRQTLTPRELIKKVGIIKNRVYLFKRFRDKESVLWRIVDPMNLVRILFPPLTFSSLFFQRFEDSNDFRLLPFKYAYAVCERLQLWKECARERVFLI